MTQKYSRMQLPSLPFLLQNLGNHLCSRISVLQDADRLCLPTNFSTAVFENLTQDLMNQTNYNRERIRREK